MDRLNEPARTDREHTDHDAAVRRILSSVAYERALATLDREHDRIVEDIVKLTQIPAPPFGEAKKASAYLAELQAHGLSDVEIDAEGNVMGRRRGAARGPLVVIAAHLDTVFPAGTDVTVRREGTRLYAPGVGDDTRSLAVLLGYIRAMDAAGITTKSDILFVGNVGEEGPGDLRGVRYLLKQGKYAGRVGYFMSLDGLNEARLVTGGVGSRRYRVTFSGPGGHSFAAFGIVSPSFAMADAIGQLGQIDVPAKPKTTYSVSVLGGGTSINSIPNRVWMEVDLRSESAEDLARLEERFLALLQQAAEAENSARSTAQGLITVETKLTGDRPAGHTDLNADIVRYAAAAVSAHGLTPEFEYSSTDSNIPMSLGIQAITVGSGCKGDRAHSLDEWIDVEKEASVKGMAVGFTVLLALAGVE